MRYPEFINENETIGFVAPSFGCATEPYLSLFNNARKKLSDLSYGQKLGPNAYEALGIGISNKPNLCGKELNDAYTDPEIKSIISCGGGELMCEVVPYIDFELIKKSAPKWYMGYSDNTNFTFLSATLSDTAAIYGPCISSFGMEPWHPSIWDALSLFTGKNLTVHGYDMWEGPEEKEGDTETSLPETEPLEVEENPLDPYHPNRKTEYRIYLPSEKNGGSSDTSSPADASDGLYRYTSSDSNINIEGRLIGGCMDCLENLIGGEFDKVKEFSEKYRDDGIIWFLEACDLNVFSIRRTLWHMKTAGWFKYVKGFLIGRPYCFGQELMGLDQYTAVTGILSDCKVPVLMDLDIGHLPPMMSLITGAYAKVSANSQQITIEHILK